MPLIKMKCSFIYLIIHITEKIYNIGRLTPMATNQHIVYLLSLYIHSQRNFILKCFTLFPTGAFFLLLLIIAERSEKSLNFIVGRLNGFTKNYYNTET